jgi:hypothetical protein
MTSSARRIDRGDLYWLAPTDRGSGCRPDRRRRSAQVPSLSIIGYHAAMKRMGVIVVGLSFVACAARESDGSGSASSGSASSPGSTTGTSGAEAGSATGNDSTTGDVPAACVDAGWQTSVAAYEALAEQSDDTYWYAIASYEYLDDLQTQCSYLTTIEYVAGVAVRRTFELTKVPDGHTADECLGVAFVEEGDAVGSMDMLNAAPARTMPELYAGCCDLLALEPSATYSDHFEIDDDGLVVACYTIENDCGEGCEASVDGFSGFSFEAFAFGTPP